MESIRLEVTDLSKYYISGREVTAALNDISLSFATGEFIAVTGESGSGKSTISHILAGILPFERGILYVNGCSTFHYSEEEWERYRLEKVSFSAQNYGILPGNTVLENVTSILRLLGMDAKATNDIAARLLRQVGMWKYRKRRAARLSSGQKQRLSVARALAKPAPVLIVDEPTSNLDRANACKIIKLLSDAAKDRLVIMVTHDFDLVKEYATRQIMLHDGMVESDIMFPENIAKAANAIPSGAPLESPAADAIPGVLGTQKPAKGKKQQTLLGWYISRLQLHARPAWTFFMAAFFTLTAFAVFAFLGTFIVSLDDTSTRNYNNDAFRNGDNTRLVVTKETGLPLTKEDYDALLFVPWVESVEAWDVVADINYYYREGTDYRYYHSAVIDEVSSSYVTTAVLEDHSHFVRTVPVMKPGKKFLKAGSYPAHMNEVVAVGDEDLIGTTMLVYLLDRSHWNPDSYICQEMTIVGVTDYGSGLYFNERIGKMINQYFNPGEYGTILYGVNNTLAENEMNISKALSKSIRLNPGDEILMGNYNKAEETVPLVLAAAKENDSEEAAFALNLSGHRYYCEITEANFDRLNLQEACSQASVFLADYSYTDRAAKEIRNLGFEVISPYRLGSVIQDKDLADARLMTLVLCILALVTVFAAQLLVLSAMFGLEMKNYASLANLGLSCHIGQISIFGQVLLLTFIGQALALLIIQASSLAGTQRFLDILKYLNPLHITAICLLHLLASMLVVLIVCRMLRRRVFPFARRSFDIDLAELDEKLDTKGETAL